MRPHAPQCIISYRGVHFKFGSGGGPLRHGEFSVELLED